MALGNPEVIYGVQLLDDIHNYFPDLLYNNQRFTTVQGVLQYITLSTQQNFDLFNYGREQYNNRMNRSQQDTDSKADDSEEEEEDENVQPQNTMSTLQRIIQSMTSAAPAPATAPAVAPFTTATATATPPALLTAPLLSYVPVARGGSVASYRTQGLYGLLPSIDNIIYPTLNTSHDIFDANINLLSALTGYASIHPQVSRSFLDPVPVLPTPAQVQTATTLRTLDIDVDDNCSICQDSMRNGESVRQITVCSHTFHKTCIDTWFMRNVRCPVCRHDIRETGGGSGEGDGSGGSGSSGSDSNSSASRQNSDMEDVE